MAALDPQEVPAALDMAKLESNDGKIFIVEKILTKHCGAISAFFEDGLDLNTVVPLPNIDGPTLEKVLKWAEQHKNEPVMVEDPTKEKRTDDITLWDQDFFNVELKVFFDLLLAANYLDMRALLETGCKTFANMVRGKTPEQLRKLFGIVNDFTEEEEEQIRRENAWCED